MTDKSDLYWSKGKSVSVFLIISILVLLFWFTSDQVKSLVSESNIQLIVRIVPDTTGSANEFPLAEAQLDTTGTKSADLIDQTVPDTLMIYACVLKEGSPLDSVHVWAVAYDQSGNSFSPDPDRSDEDGRVILGPIPMRIGFDNDILVSRINVRALYQVAGMQLIDETVVLSINRPKVSTTISVNATEFQIIGAFFLASILLAFIPARCGGLPKFKFAAVAILTILFGVAVIYVFVEGSKFVYNAEQDTNISRVSLGFVQVVKASYLPEQSPDEWIVALTAPEDGIPGFGAPLWVILVSVVGAVLIAVGLIIRELKPSCLRKKDGDNEKEADADKIPPIPPEHLFQDKVQALLKQQLYILFAPIGAIFVYQSLLITGMADERITVGIAALAAGGGLGILLGKAHRLIANLLPNHLDEEKDTNQETNGSG